MATLEDVNGCAVYSPRKWARRRERRADLHQVLEAVVASLAAQRRDRALDEGALQGAFESELSRVVPAQSVRLREVPSRYQARLVTPTRTMDSVVFDVPVCDPARQVVLEATFEPGRLLDEWNVELLSAAAQLGALVLEAESRRIPVPSSVRLDGAAPLIGSTPQIQVLRDRVERVANTDFTVLIEGSIGR